MNNYFCLFGKTQKPLIRKHVLLRCINVGYCCTVGLQHYLECAALYSSTCTQLDIGDHQPTLAYYI